MFSQVVIYSHVRVRRKYRYAKLGQQSGVPLFPFKIATMCEVLE